VREIMGGMRTMEGEPANGTNGGAMLGDESDIHLWKVVAAYGALHAEVATNLRLVERYLPPGDVAETAGLPHFLTPQSIRSGVLVQQDGRWMRPELAGFIRQLHNFAQRRLKPVETFHWRLGAAVYPPPLAVMSVAGIPAMSSDVASHQTGASIDIYVQRDASGRAVDSVLEYLFTLDRIYRRSHKTADKRWRCFHVTLNPRFAAEFLPALKR
jgi:hypothetical protein